MGLVHGGSVRVAAAVVLKWVFAFLGALVGGAAGIQLRSQMPDMLIQTNIWMVVLALCLFAGIAFGLFVGSALEAEVRKRQDGF